MKAIRFLTENQDIKQLVEQFYKEWQDATDYVITFTSGSTGKPREIKLKKEFMKASALASGKFFQFQKGQLTRLALSPQTIGGKMLLLRAWLHEMIIEVVEPSSHPLDNITTPIDFISLVPYQLEHILKKTPEELCNVRTVLLGGGPISNLLLERIQQLPCQVYASYGMTETMSHVALRNLKTAVDFQAIPGVTFSTNENQQLTIHAPLIGVNHLETNDVVDLISDTTFIWKGRSDFAINSAGVKIHPEMVENALYPYISERFFIIGEPDEVFGERVVLVIEGRKDDQPIPFEKIVSKYEIPKQIYYVHHFIETTSGKIDRLSTKNLIDASKNC